jgi:hypothetical protein
MIHASVEVLSSYLDDELTAGRRQRVERHLRQCEECRRQLEGLQAVVRHLEGLSKISPAPYLEQRVLQQAAADKRQESLLDRLEKNASRLHIERWVWMPTFGMVIALASIIYLFSLGLERQGRGLPVVLEAQYPAAEATEEALVASPESRSPVADTGRAGAAQPKRQMVGLADVADSGLASRDNEVGGTLFHFLDGVWLEAGVDPGEAFLSLQPSEAATSAWREKLPSLEELEGLGGPVRLRAGDQLVQVEFDRP